MTPTNLLELCRNGDPSAIATLLNRGLQGKNATASADWQGDQLNVRLKADTLPSQTGLLALVHRTLKTLQVEAVETLRVYAYEANNPVPVWMYQMDLRESIEQDSEEGDPLSDLSASPTSSTASKASLDRFLVCGLGGLGQYCVYSLKRFALREFEIRVTAIEKFATQEWEVQDLPSLLDEPAIIGDCRDDQVLLRAGIQDCRAVLLVTNDESVNIEAAIAARRLNPKVRLIVRSARQSLNQLLKQQLGDFLTFEPTELPANAFTLAGLGAGILGFFDIGDRRLQVVEQRVEPHDRRFDGFSANSLLHEQKYRLLSHIPANLTVTNRTSSNRAFYKWRAGTQVRAGDTVTYIELIDQSKSPIELTVPENNWRSLWQKIQETGGLGGSLALLWRWIQAKQTRLVVGVGLTTSLLLWILGTVILKSNIPGMTWERAISSGAILLLGGYGDLFGGLTEEVAVPSWVPLVCLLITAISLLFILGVFGLITDTLISSRFSFLRKRPPIPKRNHIVLVGFGRVGQRIAAVLKEFKQPFVAIAEQLDDPHLQTQMPLLVGNPLTELARTNFATAKSVIVVTEDQMLNLEVALLARNAAQQIHRNIGLVVRTYEQRFSNNLSDLLPDAKTLTAYALSAEAFASAAFGENILGLFRLNHQTILVTEYRVGTADTLVNKTLAQVAYGYGVVPVYHQTVQVTPPTAYDPDKFLLPPDERLLTEGDRLVILSSINGLRRIEHGDMLPSQRWRLAIARALKPGDVFDCSSLLFRLSSCTLEQARSFMANLPGSMELDLYSHQAYRLEEELGRQVPVQLEAIAQEQST
ncbi:MAG: NAD-binding protein [Timaviella obliquedivisa GSE-PSE-MK23-08B]|jgi:voltage-gated potassium channel Kch|nr:NAD-binding protein [Timaviella obliquedivisa GSE-PSE-MK23-08B]